MKLRAPDVFCVRFFRGYAINFWYFRTADEGVAFTDRTLQDSLSPAGKVFHTEFGEPPLCRNAQITELLENQFHLITLPLVAVLLQKRNTSVDDNLNGAERCVSSAR